MSSQNEATSSQKAETMKELLKRCLLVLALAVGAALPNLAQQVELTQFDVPGSTFTGGRDINASGQVVGRYGGPGGTTHGFLRSANGDFTSVDVPGASLTAAIGINSEGDIVGNVRYIGEPAAMRHGFTLIGGTFTTVDVPGAKTTNASGINPRRDVVGVFTSADNRMHGYVLSGGVFTTIDVPGAIQTVAWKITPDGRILGAYVNPDASRHLYILRDGAFTTVDLPNGGTPTLDTGGINDHGDITGWYCNTPACAGGSSDRHGFLLSDGQFTVIDVPGLTCVTPGSVNTRGELAGAYSTNPACSDLHGFILSREAVRTALDDSLLGPLRSPRPSS